MSMTTDPYTRKLRTAAIIAALYLTVEVSVLGWLLWHGQCTHALAWIVSTSLVWKVCIDPFLVEPSVTGPLR